MAKLTSLTDDQKAQMAPWADAWIARALDPTPADEALVELGMKECYEAAGLVWHGNIVWVDSPLTVAFAGPQAALALELVRGDSAVYSAVYSAVRSAVYSAVRRGWSYYLGGWGWAYWNAYVSYYRDVVGLELDDGIWDRSRSYEAAQGAGWWWPHKEFVIVARRHTSIKRDNQGRLHSTTGPAISWGDEFAIYAIDGIRVPEWVVTAPDPARIISDELPNTEQRRVAMAHYGWDRAVHDLNLEIIEASDNPVWGTLYALPETLVERGRATLLVCQNASPDRDGTVRTYGLLASGDARTVVAAQASLARLSEAEWLTLEGAS